MANNDKMEENEGMNMNLDGLDIVPCSSKSSSSHEEDVGGTKFNKKIR